MNNISQKIQETEFYIKQLNENKISVDALISLLEYTGMTHPQYNQLEILKKRIQEINDHLNSLVEIENDLRRNLNND